MMMLKRISAAVIKPATTKSAIFVNKSVDQTDVKLTDLNQSQSA